MRHLSRLIFVLSLLAIASGSNAEGLIGSIGYAERDQIKGAEIELGYRKSFGAASLDIIPLSAIFYKDTNNRYRNENFSNGTMVCRDTTNGEFANKENCSASFSYAGVLAGQYAVTESVHIGAGVRAGRHVDGFASVRVLLNKNIGVQVRGGGKYIGVALAIGM